MKRFSIIIALFLTVCSMSSCMTTIESDLNNIELRISRLEERCKKLNEQLSNLSDLVSSLEQYDFITKVETLREMGSVVGYRIYFTNSDPITLYNGQDAETPVIGVAKGEDGVYYWTVKYPSSSEAEFIVDNYGVRIPTSAASPEFKIENGNWMVTYDGGEVWHNMGKATGNDGTSFFESVEDHGDYILFKLLNGTEIKVPTWASYEKLQEACKVANENLKSFTELASKISSELYASDVVPILNGTDTVGYRLYLSDGSNYAFYNGTATNAPVIGAARDPKNTSDSTFYWTIQYYGQDSWTWLLDEDGKKIQAASTQGKNVQLTVLPYGSEGKYYWAVAYGDGKTEFLLCDGEMVEATGEAPDGIVTRVIEMSDDRVFILLSNKEYVYIPLRSSITVTLDSPVVDGRLAMNASESVAFVCRVAEANERFDMLPVAQDGFYVSSNRDSNTEWTVTLTSPSNFAAPATSKLNLLIANGKGTIKTVSVTILHK